MSEGLARLRGKRVGKRFRGVMISSTLGGLLGGHRGDAGNGRDGMRSDTVVGPLGVEDGGASYVSPCWGRLAASVL